MQLSFWNLVYWTGSHSIKKKKIKKDFQIKHFFFKENSTFYKCNHKVFISVSTSSGWSFCCCQIKMDQVSLILTVDGSNPAASLWPWARHTLNPRFHFHWEEHIRQQHLLLYECVNERPLYSALGVFNSLLSAVHFIFALKDE